jgi:hypothetical protein
VGKPAVHFRRPGVAGEGDARGHADSRGTVRPAILRTDRDEPPAVALGELPGGEAP